MYISPQSNSLLLMILTATEIRQSKHVAWGDNSEQIFIQYFQLFAQNKADKLLGNQLHCSHTHTHTSIHKPLPIRGHQWAHSL